MLSDILKSTLVAVATAAIAVTVVKLSTDKNGKDIIDKAGDAAARMMPGKKEAPAPAPVTEAKETKKAKTAETTV